MRNLKYYVSLQPGGSGHCVLSLKTDTPVPQKFSQIVRLTDRFGQFAFEEEYCEDDIAHAWTSYKREKTGLVDTFQDHAPTDVEPFAFGSSGNLLAPRAFTGKSLDKGQSNRFFFQVVELNPQGQPTIDGAESFENFDSMVVSVRELHTYEE